MNQKQKGFQALQSPEDAALKEADQHEGSARSVCQSRIIEQL
jgi:hypothetical protein